MPVRQAFAGSVQTLRAATATAFENLLPAGDEARAQHVVHAEGLAGEGGRGGVVRRIGELLPQLQAVQDQAVAVVGNAQAVRGLAVGSGGKVGADPGRQLRARVRALRARFSVPARTYFAASRLHAAS